MDTGRCDVLTGPDMPAYSTGWIARRLGVAAATLRIWHRRYGVGPTGRTVGGHRRYVPRDLDRLERMRRLMLAGLSTAEAARVSVDPSSGPPAAAFALDRRGDEQAGAPKWASTRLQHLTNAAMALDQPVVDLLLTDALRERGVVRNAAVACMRVGWPSLLRTLGDEFVRLGRGLTWLTFAGSRRRSPKSGSGRSAARAGA